MGMAGAVWKGDVRFREEKINMRPGVLSRMERDGQT